MPCKTLAHTVEEWYSDKGQMLLNTVNTSLLVISCKRMCILLDVPILKILYYIYLFNMWNINNKKYLHIL